MERFYLRRHLFDGERLRRRTLREFAGALRSGRLIAFVGSFATEKQGYFQWSKFLKKYAQKAYDLCGDSTHREKQAKTAIKATKDNLLSNGNPITGLSVIEYALEYASQPHSRSRKNYRSMHLRHFLSRNFPDRMNTTT